MEPTTVAGKRILSARYNLEDAAADKERHAKPANITDRYAQLTINYGSIHPTLRGLVPAPTPDTTVDNFIRVCEAQQEIWRETVRFHLPKQARHTTSQPSIPIPRSIGNQYSTRRYNTAQLFYTQDTPLSVPINLRIQVASRTWLLCIRPCQAVCSPITLTGATAIAGAKTSTNRPLQTQGHTEKIHLEHQIDHACRQTFAHFSPQPSTAEHRRS